MDVGCNCAVNEPDHQWVHGHQHTVTALTCTHLVPQWRHETNLVSHTAKILWNSCDQIQHGGMMCAANCGAGEGKKQSGMRPFVSLVFQVYTTDHPLADLNAFIF